MFSTHDTIVAIATPPGRGGIGIVRLSGPDAHAVARTLVSRQVPFAPRHATLSVIAGSDVSGIRTRDSAPPPATTSPGRGSSWIREQASNDTSAIDQVVVTYFPSPASYTGDDLVELSAHGSPVVLNAIVSAAMSAGARLAEPGEFTLRAFLNGRIDLMQAEAVADLIEAVTPLQARSAFDQLQGTLTRAIGTIDAALFDLVARLEASVDFPEEGYHFVDPSSLAEAIDGIIGRTRSLLHDGRRGRLVREGLQIAIVGRPNVGKSSLFNALVGAARAIVTEVPGTTRDLVTDTVDIGGLRVTLVDTAGLRQTSDVVEAEGVRRSTGAAGVSDLILIVTDGSQPLQEADLEIFQQFVENKTLVVENKQDVGLLWRREGAIPISAATGIGLDHLRQRILEHLDFEVLADRPALTNVRHLGLVERAHAALHRAHAATLADGGALSEEFVLADLQDARAALEEITGKRASEELLTHIFTRFCIGK